MEQQKSNISNTSTAERDQRPPEKDTTCGGGGGRTYECTFCKRGFTNAQALGGHMNIHRKDKAKSKGKLKNHENLTRFPRVGSSGHGCNPVFGGHVNYEVYFTSPNHSFQTRNYFLVDCHKDPIGLCPPDEDGADVDLELRLGLYP